MRACLITGLAVSLLWSGAAGAAGTEAGAAGVDAAALRARARPIFGTLPRHAGDADHPLLPARVELGRRLFHEARLSRNGKVSCNSCHDLERFGVDGEATSPGLEGKRGERNSPTVYNAALHLAQFWDGRAADVEEQAKGPILSPVEMGMPSAEAVVAALEGIPEYGPLFRAAFPGEAEPVTFDNVARAIGAFERTLVTPSRFDAFLAGDLGALSEAELRGLGAFLDTGCVTCHAGPLVGGAMFQKLGLVRPFPTRDPGRFAVTGNPADRQVFKVPSLRNVARTGPYFHDGSVPRLEQAIMIMAHHQLGRDVDEAAIRSIAAFLGSLTGEIAP